TPSLQTALCRQEHRARRVECAACPVASLESWHDANPLQLVLGCARPRTGPRLKVGWPAACPLASTSPTLPPSSPPRLPTAAVPPSATPDVAASDQVGQVSTR